MSQEKLRRHIYEPHDQQSSLVLSAEEEDAAQQPFLTELDLPFFNQEPSPPASSTSLPSSSLSSALPTTSSSASSATTLGDDAVSGPFQNTPPQETASKSPQQAQHGALASHAEAQARTQSTPPSAQPQPSWGSSPPADANPGSNLWSATAAGRDVDSDQAEGLLYSDDSSVAQHWHAANVVPEGLELQPQLRHVGAALLQTPTQLPVFALDALLWPNQIMMLRQVLL
ncbi:hypothetical protein ABBQ32_004758 [Trebouxia sp. C0010 RCD-2024]